IPKNAFVLIFIGKFIEIKRPLDLARAFKNILDKDLKNIHVIFVGDGPLLNQLENETTNYKSYFHFVGFKNQSEVPSYLAACDLLVLSSFQETWGLVVNEAMACGIPVLVSSGVGCAPDLVEDGKTGFIFDMGNINSLERKIIESFDEIQNRNSELKKNIADKISIYSMKNATKKLLAALDIIKNEIL
ncbi:MAG: glycosyltransferase family 4 protein, partial [Thermodesulfobacteriota bacterium]